MKTKIKFSKQILIVLLCIAMVMSYMPMPVYAAASTTIGLYTLTIDKYEFGTNLRYEENVTDLKNVTVEAQSNNKLKVTFRAMSEGSWTVNTYSVTVSNQDCTQDLNKSVIVHENKGLSTEFKFTGTLTRKAQASHTGGTATCVAGAKCSVCGEEYSQKQENNHSWSEWTSTDTTTHTRTCNNGCGETQSGEHISGTVTCGQQPICLTCNSAYGAVLSHNLTYAIKNDTTNVLTETCENACGHYAEAKLSADDSTYTGSAIETAAIKYDDNWKGTNKPTAIEYTNNTKAGSATATITVEGKELSTTFKINEVDISSAEINISPSNVSYNGSKQEPNISVSWNGTSLNKDTDYEISWDKEEFINIDTYTATIKGINNFSGEVRRTFTIGIGSMTGIAISGYSGTYDGNEHGISITGVPDGATVTYKTSEDGIYTETKPTFKDAGNYTVWYKIEKDNYESITGSAEVKIEKIKLTVEAEDKTITYGDGDSSLTWQITEGKMVGTETLSNIAISRKSGNDAGDYTITVSQPDGENKNYDITFKNGTFKIKQKEISISWGATMFLPYNGKSLVPKPTVANLVDGDECNLTTDVVENTDGAGIIPGTWTAEITALSNSNYKLPENVRVQFEIVYGYQNEAPAVTGVNETIYGKSDGKISGVDSTMEYRKEGEETYTAINDAELTNLEAETYYVRYAAKTYYNPSPDKKVVISAGRKLTVNIPNNQVGYTLSVNKTEFEYKEIPTLTLVIHDGYSETEHFAVKVNGIDINWDDFTEIALEKITENVEITVEGVADITAPRAEIQLKDNKWNQFWNNITFGKFFNETQKVTIVADDVNTGSGLDNIYYYLATEELTETEIEELSSWVEYNGSFSINPNNEYIIYAKAVDKAGNIVYISSEGIIVDTLAPVIKGVENGGTYYGDTEFEVEEKYLDSITVDGKSVELTDGKYTITANGNEHTIVVTDKAENSNKTMKITVVTIASLDDSIENIKTTDVKSSDKDEINKVLDLVDRLINSEKKFTDTEDTQLKGIKSNAEKLLEQIDDVVSEVVELTNKVEEYEESKVTSDDKETLSNMISDIDKLLAKDNLTDAEKETLNGAKEDYIALVNKIDDVAAEIKDLAEKVDDYDKSKVTSDDKQNINELISDIEKLLEGSNLTNTEKAELGEVKADAKGLISKIEKVATADDTDNTEKVKDVTSKNVTMEDKADLVAAKDDLEKVLDDYNDNLTKDEKKAIMDEIDRINEALEVIGKVEAVENKINSLPDNIAKNDEASIDEANDAYDVLSDYEKSLVDQKVKKTLDDAISVITDLNHPAEITNPNTGDNSNIEWWFALLIISIVGLAGISIYGKKKNKRGI